MRLQWLIFGVVLVLTLVTILEAKEEHHHKKHKAHRRRWHHPHHKHHHRGGHDGKQDEDRRMSLHPDKHEVHMKKINWLNVPEVVGCECKHQGEICIQGPDKRPTCVQEHHLRESARLFKHYHEDKERAEEYLNQVDPKPSSLNAVHLEAPHDVHINLETQHNALRRPEHVFHGMKPKEGKHERERDLIDIPHFQKDEKHESSKAVCDAGTMDEMRRRLTGWFHLLHGKEHHHPVPHHHKSHKHLSVKKELREGGDDSDCECLKSVMWEFRQIDTDGDHTLTPAEVKVIDNNDMEPCLHPYLLQCDADGDGLLSRREWCCCFPQKDAESPCYAKLIEIERTKNTKVFIPSCDHEGYYKKEQCEGNSDSQTCWCVTPTGSEMPGSRRSGRAHCGKLDNMGYPKDMSS